MQTKEAIEIMQEEPPEKSLIVAYWNKETVEYNADTTLTDEEWLELVEYTDYKMRWEPVNELFLDKIEEMREGLLVHKHSKSQSRVATTKKHF